MLLIFERTDFDALQAYSASLMEGHEGHDAAVCHCSRLTQFDVRVQLL